MLKKIALAIAMITLFVTCEQVEYDNYGHIIGTVLDAETNNPVSGVYVTLSPSGLNFTTGADGAFSFLNLDAMQYTLTVQKNGYSTNRKTINVLATETVNVTIPIEKIK